MDDEFDLLGLDDEEDDFPEDEDVGVIGDDEPGSSFLGMSPMERMFLSIFLFMNVAVLGVALLMATNRI
jgi:hypothetical protein